MPDQRLETLKLFFPEYVSRQRMAEILQISIKSAKYLIKKGIIPAIDTGKTTHRYEIKIDDIIAYLHRSKQWGRMIAPGAVSSRRKRAKEKRVCFADLVKMGKQHGLREYFVQLLIEYPDVLLMKDVVDITGLCSQTVRGLINNGSLKTLTKEDGCQYLFPKIYLVEFLITPRFIDSKSSSDRFKQVIDGISEWKKQ